MSLVKSGIIVSSFTFLSRVFGLGRELLFAMVFGSTELADVLNIAQKLPNLFRRILGEGALSSVFVPIFSKKLIDDGLSTTKSNAMLFASNVFALLFFITIILSVLLEIFMPELLIFFAPGLVQKEYMDLAILFSRITTPYMIFICLSSLMGGILGAYKKFAAFAGMPIILNLVTVVAMLIDNQASTFIFSYVIGGVLQFIFMYFALRKIDFRFKFDFAQDADIKLLFKKMLPAVFSYGVIQINLFVSNALASFIPGCISILNYADRIYQFPISILGTTFGTILLPSLSGASSKKSGFKIQLQAIMSGIFIAVPCMCGIYILSEDIIYVIYKRGAFTFDDVLKTANSLKAFSISIPTVVLSKILLSALYANGDTKTPLRITIYTVVLNSVLNYLFMLKYGYLGIPIGSSISLWLNVILLWRASNRSGAVVVSLKAILSDKANVIFLCRLCFANAILCLVVSYVSLYLRNYIIDSNGLMKIMYISVDVLSGIVVYAALNFDILKSVMCKKR